MSIKVSRAFHPVVWSSLILVLAQTIALTVAARQVSFLKEQNIDVPAQPPDVITLWPQPVTSPSGEVIPIPLYSSIGPIVIYFLVSVVIIGAFLFLIPASKLSLVFRFIFGLLFAWAVFVIFVVWLPLPVTLGLAALLAGSWFFVRRVWLHNLSMLLAMAALGAVFGNLIAPWTAMLVIVVIAVYDFLAVRFGYMVWMAEKLSESDNLPAFIIPRNLSGWNCSLEQIGLHELAETDRSEREYSILGGGDIGFAVLLVCSVYFATGLADALIISIFAVAGLVCVYWIQAALLKGKPMPALPPIAVFCLIGLVIASGLPGF